MNAAKRLQINAYLDKNKYIEYGEEEGLWLYMYYVLTKSDIFAGLYTQ